jgi:uncharacterized membrane protein
MAHRTVLYGPIQLFVIGFHGNQFKGEIIPAINEARENGIIRMIDYVFLMKDTGGNITAVQGTDLGRKEIKFFDSVLGALIGYGAAGAEGAELGAKVGAEYAEMNLGLTEEDIRKAAK